MPGGYGQITAKDGKPFSSTNQPKNRGRKPSIKTQLQRMVDSDGAIKIPYKQVIEIVEPKPATKTKKAEQGYIRIALPHKEALAMRLITKAMSGDYQWMKLLLEYVDGKPAQQINLDLPDSGSQIPMEDYTDAEIVEEFTRLNSVLQIEGLSGSDTTD